MLGLATGAIVAPATAAVPTGPDGQPLDTIRLVSQNLRGKAGSGDQPSASDNARWVAYDSQGESLVEGSVCPAGLNGPCAYLTDRRTKTTMLASPPVTGDQLTYGVDDVTISANGRVVVYASFADNLAVDDDNGDWDVFAFDRTTGAVELLSRNPAGEPANGDSFDPDVSRDGRYVVYHSSARDLVPGDPNGPVKDVFLLDREAGTTSVINLSLDGGRSALESTAASISDDGQFVTFQSESSDLVEGDDNASGDVFVHEVATGQTELLSRTAGGDPGNGDSFGAMISGDGSAVAFGSAASDLVAGDANGDSDVFVADRASGAVTLVSRTPAGVPGDWFSLTAQPSRDGSLITFVSAAADLVEQETHSYVDVYVFERATGDVTWVSHTPDGLPPNGQSWRPTISGDGSFVMFASIANNLARDGSRRHYNVYAYRVS